MAKWMEEQPDAPALMALAMMLGENAGALVEVLQRGSVTIVYQTADHQECGEQSPVGSTCCELDPGHPLPHASPDCVWPTVSNGKPGR